MQTAYLGCYGLNMSQNNLSADPEMFIISWMESLLTVVLSCAEQPVQTRY